MRIAGAGDLMQIWTASYRENSRETCEEQHAIDYTPTWAQL